MEGKEKILVHKFTLTTGKVIYLREAKINDLEQAAKVAGSGDTNQMAMGLSMQKEIFKRLLVQIGDKRMTLNDKETCLDQFNLKEFGQILSAVGQLADFNAPPPQSEIVKM